MVSGLREPVKDWSSSRSLTSAGRAADGLPPPRAFMLFAVLPWAFVVAVFALAFWGYPIQRTNFSDFLFYTKDLPPFWGLSLVDPQTHQINYSFLLHHNEGFMALTYFLLNHLALATAHKLVFVNILNIGIQFLNILLFAAVLRKLVGPRYLFPYLMVFVLYPFAAANRYWQVCIANNFVPTFFLLSLRLFLQVDYAKDRLFTNLVFRVAPSVILLWLSIIMVEFAIALSPIYVYLALYYSNGKRTALRFKKCVTPYTVAASLFLLTSIVPVFLFTGHRLTVMSYTSRYTELATQMNLAASLAAAATIVVNALLTYASFFFANTVGVIVYPLAEIAKCRHLLNAVPSLHYLGILLVAVLGPLALWINANARTNSAEQEPGPDFRFLVVLGLLWMVLAYFPFSISFGYPRNVGLIADRINLLGAMGATLLLGSGLCIVCDRKRSPGLFWGVGGVIAVLLLNIQLQQTQYVDAERKELALVDAVLETNQRLRSESRTPIFLLHRQVQIASPRAKLREVLDRSSALLRFAGLAGFLWERYLTQPTVSTSFHFNGIYLFWCCPASAQSTFDFFADWRGVPRPVVFKQEEPFRWSEDPTYYHIGYLQTEVWQGASTAKEAFATYPKKDYQLVVMDIGESTFLPGGPLQYRVQPYRGEEK